MNLVFGIILLVMYVVMMSIMIIFERDKPKNIILWSLLFIFTQVVGYVVYLLSRKTYYDKRNSLLVKQHVDEVYTSLVEHKLNVQSIKMGDELLEHNALAFNSLTTENNQFEIFDAYDKFKANLIKELKSATHYILMELSHVNSIDFNEVAQILMEKASDGLMVKYVYDRPISHTLRRNLKSAGVRVHRFSKHNVIGKIYGNLRNLIVIDGRLAYIANMNISKDQLKDQNEVASAIMKIKGDMVQNINLSLHQDVIFASGKYIEYNDYKKESISSDSVMQYVSNKIESNIELLLIKAICMAKKSIQMELRSFIPTESIMSLLHFAINSNIDVRLMVPLKTDIGGRFYASRAYAKELALLGANVYLYDGYINFNAINIDNEYVLYGSYTLDRAHISTSLQNVCVIKDTKVINHFNKMFDEGINNSYRINDAKFMLLREKFFKNFV